MKAHKAFGDVALIMSQEEAERLASVAAHARRYYERDPVSYKTLERVYDAISLPSKKLRARGRSHEELFSALETLSHPATALTWWEKRDARRKLMWGAW